MERVLDLSLDARAFTTPPPAGVDYSFNVSKRKAVVLKLRASRVRARDSREVSGEKRRHPLVLEL